MNQPLSRKQMETRRLLAVAALKRGVRQAQVGRDLGVSRTTVSRWYAILVREGVKGLCSARAPGRRPRMERVKLEALVREIAATELKAPMRVKEFANELERRGVRYHPSTVGRLMKAAGVRGRREQRKYLAAAVLEREEVHEDLLYRQDQAGEGVFPD